jgi:hypothetical protein
MLRDRKTADYNFLESALESVEMKTGKMIRIPLSALSTILVLSSFLACSRYDASVIDLVPSDSCAVVVVEWSTLRKDNELKRLFKGEQFEVVLEHLGIDSSSVKTLVVFSAINSRAKAGMLLRGSFDKQKQIASLKTRGWLDTTVDGHKVYVKGNDYAALPQNNMLFAGTREAAAAVFNALNNTRDSFDSTSAYKKISAGLTTRNEPIKAFLVTPQGTLDMANAALEATSVALSRFDLGGIGALLKQINIASGFGLTLGHASNQMYPVEMCVLMRDEKAAALVSGSLSLMKGFSTAASTSNGDEQARQALHGMSITRVREVLTISMSVPQAVLMPPSGR